MRSNFPMSLNVYGGSWMPGPAKRLLHPAVLFRIAVDG